MTSEKAAIVLYTVITRSAQGQIKWTETTTEDAFEASFPNETLRIVREEGVDNDGDDYTLVTLEILNSSGRVVETIHPYSVRAHFKNPWEMTKALFSEARDIALGVDEAVTDLLKSLGGPIVPPKVPLSTDGEDVIPF